MSRTGNKKRGKKSLFGKLGGLLKSLKFWGSRDAIDESKKATQQINTLISRLKKSANNNFPRNAASIVTSINGATQEDNVDGLILPGVQFYAEDCKALVDKLVGLLSSGDDGLMKLLKDKFSKYEINLINYDASISEFKSKDSYQQRQESLTSLHKTITTQLENQEKTGTLYGKKNVKVLRFLLQIVTTAQEIEKIGLRLPNNNGNSAKNAY